MTSLSLFSLLHVPLNIPLMAKLGPGGGGELDIDREFRVHGYANLLSGVTGSLQNYLVFCNSAMYHGSGGRSRTASILISVFTLGFTIFGTVLISYVPRCLAGGIMAHLGLLFVQDALYESWGALGASEYLTVLAISLSMVLLGFLEGIGLGLALACGSFIVEASRNQVLRRVLHGSSLHSSVRRT